MHFSTCYNDDYYIYRSAKESCSGRGWFMRKPRHYNPESGGCRRGRRGDCEKVKWLGVILDEDLDFSPHWETRIAKARNLLGALDGVGTSK